ncbi:hypothetical protein [Nocardioides sp. LS1]|uniref:hypothetical protein n=1 Tax=Nocardioides sp. LS1 TaxID=1027620 RepID=UPI000F626F6F|nr:hypothetical protein [Nocardioides sp. LS1]GCD90171.1 hypothetical protein NLS1_21770 [Nocardioides sp. LS1]
MSAPATWQVPGLDLEVDRLLQDWVTWLRLSSTPHRDGDLGDAVRVWAMCRGNLLERRQWPREAGPRVYMPIDVGGPAYVGQTVQPLAARMAAHFGNLRSPAQREKALSWVGVVSVTFSNLRHGDLGRLERSAAEWVLPLHRRVGRSWPRC